MRETRSDSGQAPIEPAVWPEEVELNRARHQFRVRFAATVLGAVTALVMPAVLAVEIAGVSGKLVTTMGDGEIKPGELQIAEVIGLVARWESLAPESALAAYGLLTAIVLTLSLTESQETIGRGGNGWAIYAYELKGALLVLCGMIAVFISGMQVIHLVTHFNEVERRSEFGSAAFGVTAALIITALAIVRVRSPGVVQLELSHRIENSEHLNERASELWKEIWPDGNSEPVGQMRFPTIQLIAVPVLFYFVFLIAWCLTGIPAKYELSLNAITGLTLSAFITIYLLPVAFTWILVPWATQHKFAFWRSISIGALVLTWLLFATLLSVSLTSWLGPYPAYWYYGIPYCLCFACAALSALGLLPVSGSLGALFSNSFGRLRIARRTLAERSERSRLANVKSSEDRLREELGRMSGDPHPSGGAGMRDRDRLQTQKTKGEVIPPNGKEVVLRRHKPKFPLFSLIISITLAILWRRSNAHQSR
jgi:hypothetical protein